MNHVSKSFIEINPTAAAELDVSDGEYARVESRCSDIVVKATVTDRIGDGTLFIPMYFAAGAINKLTQKVLNPQASIPEFKVSNAHVEPFDPDADPDMLRIPDTGIGGITRGDG